MADIVSKINSKAIALKQNVSGFFFVARKPPVKPESQ